MRVKKERWKLVSKSIKKSDHKHDYELVEMKEKRWFTHEKKCKICGHINNRIRVMDIEKAKNDIVYFSEKS